MNRGSFLAQINEVERVLSKIDSIYYREYFPRYESASAAELRSLTYKHLWEHLVRCSLFDFRLEDGALIQFRRYAEQREICYMYAYYECPYKVPTYSDFLGMYELTNAEAGDIFQAEYEEFLQSAMLKDTVTPARYDYLPHAYIEGRHPAAHIHFGHATEIRIGTKKLLKPVSFLFFILRQFYPTRWSSLLNRQICRGWRNAIRGSLDDVSANYFGPKDELEMQLL